MYHHISDFLTDWGHESASTVKLFKKLTDESLDKKLHPKVRTLGFLAWHIVHTLQEMPARTGLKVDIPDHQDYRGESVKQIVETYEKGAAMLAEQIKQNWTDADLKKEDDMYGQMWKRGTTLQILITHQAHHRAEMLVLMRMLDLPVVGIYGPTQEEWTQYGMPVMN
ncbi:MAG TPA: DinB family protein [Bacteroidia bacterium]|nr:DinB family protein [Bacteroidia bacterium]HNP97571.1 DinB family protein [Bacteroidia bacterium]